MIQKAKFRQKWFIDLYKIVKDYGSVWVTETGRIYRNENQALSYKRDNEKLAIHNDENIKSVRIARINYIDFPFKSKDVNENIAKLRELFEKFDRIYRHNENPVDFDKPLVSAMTDEEAINEMMDNTDEKPKEQTISVNGGQYEFSVVKAALKEIDPKFKLNTSMTNTQNFVDSLDEEKMASLIEKITL